MYGESMDRRQRKSRRAIFGAFIELLSKKDFHNITVGEIIERADVGRATFYSHFETKDFLLKELCEELFCHIFDVANDEKDGHNHIFDCEAPDSVFLHLLLSQCTIFFPFTRQYNFYQSLSKFHCSFLLFPLLYHVFYEMVG